MTELASTIWFYLFVLMKHLKKKKRPLLFWNTIAQYPFPVLAFIQLNEREMLLRYYYRVLVHDDHYLILRSEKHRCFLPYIWILFLSKPKIFSARDMHVALTLCLLSHCIPYYVHLIIALLGLPKFASITTVNNTIHYSAFFKRHI